VGILLLLSVAFHNGRNLVLALVNVPSPGGARAGGVADHQVRASLVKGLDIGSLVGFVTLFGITTRNSIMMISTSSTW